MEEQLSSNILFCKASNGVLDILGEISQCSKQYVENRCSPEQRVPAMERSCLLWEQCMKRDPSVIGRAKLSAETFAEIINGLIEPISYKTMIFMLVALFGTLFLSNYAFSAARHRVGATGHTRAILGPMDGTAGTPLRVMLLSLMLC